ncbi:hypothetical protein HanIR_Chr15g0772751 [Helianthus annuus]|nr:hypothetical protein HanIR_Chr15g0772751 [Helianthus annuus]
MSDRCDCGFPFYSVSIFHAEMRPSLIKIDTYSAAAGSTNPPCCFFLDKLHFSFFMFISDCNG